MPKMPLEFKSLIEIKITTQNKVLSSSLRKLKSKLKNPVIVFENSGRRSEKKIFNSKYKKIAENKFTLTIDVEGGFPVKRFVIGDNVVPGLSQTLNDNCICGDFDFLRIQMITNN
jgi:tRNA pseudouridine synthase 10